MFTLVLNASKVLESGILNASEYRELLEKLMRVSGGVKVPYIDDHNETETGKDMPWNKFALLYSGRSKSIKICPVKDGALVCLNPLYLDEGAIHLSRSSVGGLVNTERNSDVTPELIERSESGEFLGYITL